MPNQAIIPYTSTVKFSPTGITPNAFTAINNGTLWSNTFSISQLDTFYLEDKEYFITVSDIIRKFGQGTASKKYYSMYITIAVTAGKIQLCNNICPSNYHFKINGLISQIASPSSTQGVCVDVGLYFSNPILIIANNNITELNYNITANRTRTDSACKDVISGYITMPQNSISVTIYGDIFMDVYCNDNFNDPICLKFCNNTTNSELCVEQSLRWCFNDLSPLLSNFFQPTNCKPFIQNYISNNISHIKYDKKFKQICNLLRVDPTNYKNYTYGTDPVIDNDIKELCACNMDDSVYINFFESFANDIPTVRSANIGSKKCIFPECAGTLYKPTELLGFNTCPKIECINVTQINNDGTISGSFTVNQTAECPNITDPRKPCTTDGDCGLEQKCFLGKCVDKLSCRIDSECSRDEKCLNNRCTRDDYCLKDTDCSETLKCEKNICTMNVSTINSKITLSIFVVINVILLIIFGIILLIFFIKRLKRS